MKTMKILVIDDNTTNQKAAIAQLGEKHKLTVIGSYGEAEELLSKKHGFDVVLADLLMPASEKHQGPKGERFVGQEMPIGIFLALLAAKNGAQYVAVFTDSDHHDHPASACFDHFSDSSISPEPFTVNNATVILCNNSNWVNEFRPENLAEEMRFKEWFTEKKPSVCAKNWKKLLDYLLKED